MVVPEGMNSECTTPVTHKEAVIMTSPVKGAVLNFFYASEPL
jgi:hypothetical protein